MMIEVGNPAAPGKAVGGARVVDADPLRTLFETQYRPMVRVATALLGDASAAEDVVQEAFVAMDRALPRVEPDARAAYLRRCVMNGARSSIRRHRAVKRQPIPQREDVAHADESALRHEQHDRVLTALDALPFRQRQCLVLRYYAGLSDPEVADALGLSLGSAKTHIRRGLDSLHDALGDLR